MQTVPYPSDIVRKKGYVGLVEAEEIRRGKETAAAILFQPGPGWQP